VANGKKENAQGRIFRNTPKAERSQHSHASRATDGPEGKKKNAETGAGAARTGQGRRCLGFVCRQERMLKKTEKQKRRGAWRH